MLSGISRPSVVLCLQKYTFSRKRNLFPLKNNEKVPIAALKSQNLAALAFFGGVVLMDYSYS